MSFLTTINIISIIFLAVGRDIYDIFLCNLVVENFPPEPFPWNNYKKAWTGEVADLVLSQN